MATTFEVVLYQLNAGLDTQGDSAVALLTSKVGTASAKIKNAVLIDGGYGKNVAVVLKTTITAIKAAYAIPADREFKFDAVSLSHWDKVSFASNSFSDLALTYAHRTTSCESHPLI